MSVGPVLQAYAERAPIVATHINCICAIAGICIFFGFFDFLNKNLIRKSNKQTNLRKHLLVEQLGLLLPYKIYIQLVQ